MNNLKHRVTQQTPNNLVMGFQPRNILQNHLSLTLQEELIFNEPIELNELRLKASERIKAEQNRIINEQEGKLKPKKFKVGDLILIRFVSPATGTSRKIHHKYKGPYVIEKVLPCDRYLITDCPQTQISQKPFKSIYASDKIKSWCQLSDFEVGDREASDYSDIDNI